MEASNILPKYDTVLYIAAKNGDKILVDYFIEKMKSNKIRIDFEKASDWAFMGGKNEMEKYLVSLI